MVLSLSSPPLTWSAPVHPPPLSIPIPLSTLHSALRILLRNLHPQSAYYVFTCQQTYQSKPLTLLSVGLQLFCLVSDCSRCPGVSILAIRRPTSYQLTPYQYTRSIDLFETKPTRANELTPIAALPWPASVAASYYLRHPVESTLFLCPQSTTANRTSCAHPPRGRLQTHAHLLHEHDTPTAILVRDPSFSCHQIMLRRMN